MAKLYIEDTQEVRKAVSVLEDSDTAPAGYIDKSDSIEDWNTSGSTQVGCDALPDMLALREIIKTLVAAKTFSSCTAEEKVIASQWFVVDKVDRDTVRTDEEQAEDQKDILYKLHNDAEGGINHICIFTDNGNPRLAQIKVNENNGIYSVVL